MLKRKNKLFKYTSKNKIANQKNHYRLLEYSRKQKKAKVLNFKRQKIEIYFTGLTSRERHSKKQRLLQLKKEKYEEKCILIEQSWRSYFNFLKKYYYGNLYLKYAVNYRFSLRNSLIESMLMKYYHGFCQMNRVNGFPFDYSLIRHLGYKICLKDKFSEHNRYSKSKLNIISVYVILRRTNIYVTVIKDGKLSKIFSPCLFNHISKNGKKKSISYFYTVKRTIMYITRIFLIKKKYII
jgi:hypothetical protein